MAQSLLPTAPPRGRWAPMAAPAGWRAKSSGCMRSSAPRRSRTLASRSATQTSRPLLQGCGRSPAFAADSCGARWPTSHARLRLAGWLRRREPWRVHRALAPTSTDVASVALGGAEIAAPALDRDEVPLVPVDGQGQLQDAEGADPHLAVGLRAEERRQRSS